MKRPIIRLVHIRIRIGKVPEFINVRSFKSSCHAIRSSPGLTRERRFAFSQVVCVGSGWDGLEYLNDQVIDSTSLEPLVVYCFLLLLLFSPFFLSLETLVFPQNGTW